MKSTLKTVFGLAVLCGAVLTLAGCAAGYSKKHAGTMQMMSGDQMQYDGSVTAQPKK